MANRGNSPPRPKGSPAPGSDVVARWLKATTKDIGKHGLILLVEEGGRAALLDELRHLVRAHYVAPETTAKRLAKIGAPKTAALLKEHLPVTKEARSGDLGEILATEVAELHLGYVVPVRRLRWKDGRNMALRGDDIIGVSRDTKNQLQFVKGESKSRVALSTAAIDEASEALDRDRGRPTRHSVLFVAERLRERGEDELATEFELAVLDSFRGRRIEHLLFTLVGSNPEALLSEHLKKCATKKRRRHAVGVRIKDHATFIADRLARARWECKCPDDGALLLGLTRSPHLVEDERASEEGLPRCRDRAARWAVSGRARHRIGLASS